MDTYKQTNLSVIQEMFGLFAGFFEYPCETLIQSIQSCQVLLEKNFSKTPIGNEFTRFTDFVLNNPLKFTEEAYTQILDMNSHFHPYIGAHIFDDSYKRSYFLVKLKDEFRVHQFSPPENELPDHITVLLRFLSKIDDLMIIKEFLENFIVPVYNKVLGITKGYENLSFEDTNNNDEVLDVDNSNTEEYNPLLRNDYGDDPGVTEDSVIDDNNPYYYLIIALWHFSKQILNQLNSEAIRMMES